jgi:hypothetical protein
MLRFSFYTASTFHRRGLCFHALITKASRKSEIVRHAFDVPRQMFGSIHDANPAEVGVIFTLSWSIA